MSKADVRAQWEGMGTADRLRELRVLCGISRKAAAEVVGMSHYTIKAWELGQCSPSADDYMRLVQHYLGLLRAQ